MKIYGHYFFFTNLLHVKTLHAAVCVIQVVGVMVGTGLEQSLFSMFGASTMPNELTITKQYPTAPITLG